MSHLADLGGSLLPPSGTHCIANGVEQGKDRPVKGAPSPGEYCSSPLPIRPNPERRVRAVLPVLPPTKGTHLPAAETVTSFGELMSLASDNSFWGRKEVRLWPPSWGLSNCGVGSREHIYLRIVVEHEAHSWGIEGLRGQWPLSVLAARSKTPACFGGRLTKTGMRGSRQYLNLSGGYTENNSSGYTLKAENNDQLKKKTYKAELKNKTKLLGKQ